MIVNLQDDFLYLVGDTHSIEILNTLIDKIPMGANIFHVGDCGIGRDPSRSLRKLSNHARNRKQRIYIIRGNHDNPRCFPTSIESVELLADYTELKFPNGTNAICVGGGISLDRLDNMLDYDYWPDEVTVFKPELCKAADFLFLHDAPSYFNNQTYTLSRGFFAPYVARDPELMADSYAQRETIDKIVELVKPQRIFGGHFHNGVVEHANDIRYRCLGINEILLLNSGIVLPEAE